MKHDPRAKHARGSHGFTLVEVLLSVVILLILAGSIGWAVREMREKTIVLRRASDDLTVSTSVFELIDASMTSSVALDPTNGSAGIRGTGDSIEIVSRGVLADLDGDAGAMSGLTRLRIQFDPDALQLRIGRSEASSSAEMQPVSQRIEQMRFRYHDGQQWADSFDSRGAGTLPVAVEVSIWFASALDDRAQPPEAGTALDRNGDASGPDPLDFEGMGAPVRSDFDEEPPLIERRPDRFRIFTVLGGPRIDQTAPPTIPVPGFSP